MNKNISVKWTDNSLSESLPAMQGVSEIELLNREGWRTHTNAIYNSLQEVEETSIRYLIECIWSLYINEKQFFICGNGGSACNSNHFAQDLTKGLFD